jgi:hypothetical protein
MLDPRKLQNIADAATDPFLAGANLDRRGIPDWHNPPPEESFSDELLVRECHQDLRRELAALAQDPSVLAELAKTDPAAARELEDRQEEEAAIEFKREHPGYFVCEENADRIDAYLEAKSLPMTAENLGQAYRDLHQHGKLRVSPNEPRVIPEAEKIRLARMAANGDVQTALAGYLEQRLPVAVAKRITTAANYSIVEDIINRPENQPLLREATIEAWFWANPHTPPTAALRKWFAGYTKDMLAFNIKTLDSAFFKYLNWQEAEREAVTHNAVPEPVEPEPSPASLEDLSDAEIGELMRGVARERRASR